MICLSLETYALDGLIIKGEAKVRGVKQPAGATAVRNPECLCETDLGYGRAYN